MARKLIVEIVGDSRSFERSLKRSEAAGKKFSATFTGATSGLSRFTGAQIGVAGAAIGVAAGLRESITAASDLNESLNAVRVTFGQAADQITEFSRTAATEVGLSARAANQLVVPLGAALQNFGLSANEAAQQSIELTRRAADMASVFNTDVTQALEAIQAALRGEADPIERFGVSVNEAAVNAEALSLKLAKSTKEITAQDKAVARLSLIMRQTAKFQGDFAATSDSAANRQRILRARIEDVEATIGQRLLPVYEDALGLTLDLIDAVGGLTDKFQDFRKELDRGSGALGKVGDFFRSALGGADRRVFDPITGQLVKANEAAERFNNTLGHTLDALESLRGQRFGPQAFAGAAAGAASPAGRPSPFQLPGPLRLAQAQAGVTAAIADDVAVAKRIKAFIEARIAAGSLKGQRLIDALAELASAEGVITGAIENEASKRRDAAQKEADARRKHAEALKRAAEQLKQRTAEAMQQIGALFQGPILAPDDAQRRAALGLTAGPDPRALLADIRAQNQAAKGFRNTLTRLTRAGAPSGFVQELLAGGLSAQAGAIAAAPRALQRAIFEAFRQREALARQIAERPLRVFVTVNLDGRRVASSVAAHNQRNGKYQATQRRGPGGGSVAVKPA